MKRRKKVEGNVEIFICEKNGSECKELRSLIQKLVNRNTTNIYPKESDYVRIEYGDIIKEDVIPNDGDATLGEVWNFYNNQKFPNPDF